MMESCSFPQLEIELPLYLHSDLIFEISAHFNRILEHGTYEDMSGTHSLMAK